MSKQGILDFICQMTMAAKAYKRRGNMNEATVMTLVQGFTGQLKGWWDNFCTPFDRETILGAMKNKNEEDFVATLIYTIIQHFVGDLNIFKDRAASQLANLYCSTMSDYRWYKDVFMSKITLREFQGFWKERFIARLPKLFFGKVKSKLETHFGNPIPYQVLTYGQIHSIVVETWRKFNNNKNNKKNITCWKYGRTAHFANKCKMEIQEYLDKGLVRPSKSLWSCSRFYVMNASELERGAPRLAINYKP
uniref:DUF7746 domain-containing protein n=1 Tax=Cajanus cajan TaxID=3821 RepID=A0A151R0G8_CAJCA|nr:hypothetical protein KK1_042894 [Cajanus cajan]